MSDDFDRFYNPSPGWPFLHHNKMGYAVKAVASTGYEFSHWQAVGRKSNNPNDVYNVTYDSIGKAFPVALTLQRDNGIKSPLVYLVAHFKPVDIEQEPGPEPEPEPIPDPGPPNDDIIVIDDVTKDEIIRALDDIIANAEKIMNRLDRK